MWNLDLKQEDNIEKLKLTGEIRIIKRRTPEWF